MAAQSRSDGQKDEAARRAATEAQRPAFIEHRRGRCISDDLAACTQRMCVLAAADAEHAGAGSNQRARAAERRNLTTFGSATNCFNH